MISVLSTLLENIHSVPSYNQSHDIDQSVTHSLLNLRATEKGATENIIVAAPYKCTDRFI